MNQATGRGLHGYRLSEQVAGYEGLKVYRAISPGGRVMVSLRVFPAAISNLPHILKKFNQSTELLSQMNHPNICPLIDWGTDQGRPYLIHPYIDAGSLEARLRSGTFQALDPDQVFYDLASVLSHTHKVGLVHGNLRPSDILFDEDGQIQVVGFGEASILGALTGNSSRKPPSFRAPETGNVQNISAASDQYSLAIIALQMITNLPADEALDLLQSEKRRMEHDRKAPRTFTTIIPDAMADVFSRALSENPSKRYPSIAAAEAAYRSVTGRGVTPVAASTLTSFPTATLVSEPRSKPVRRVKKKRRRALMPILTGLLILGVSVSAGIAFWDKTGLGGSKATDDVYQTTEGIRLPPEREYPGQDLSGDGDSVSTPKGSVSGSVSPTPSSQSSTNTERTEPAQPKPANTNPVATATSPTNPTSTPDQPPGSEPTATVPSSTDTAPAPTQEPTSPSKCHSNPNSKNYCKPTPSP